MSYKIILKDNGEMHIDVDLPEGEECDDADEALRVALVAVGLADESIMDRFERTPVPDVVKDRTKG
jgi:hypothetical protein